MIIKTTQFGIFRNIAIENFIVKCREFLCINFPDDFTIKDTVRMDIFTRKTIEFGKKYQINSELNIQKLMVIELEFKFLEFEKLPEIIEEILTYPYRDEDLKVNYFHKQLIASYATE